ncbi:MarR family winged helix-turn-helix transcriptional regulator [Microbispora corallina]|uniref:Transcriptional regulator n=1 Tax=Microbispora corallina TaxID=83302 RepID=A0ABQ4GBH5_9ACTN|nr:MarR family transcriptional regulator [Microbispora corallina]GIH44377.1 transcriptional regulator [Microbispora corallina]
MSTEMDGPAVDEAVRTLLLLMPRLVGRAKRLPIPRALQSLELAPRHLALLAHLEYDGPASVNELAARLELAPTTVSLMVSELSRPGVLRRTADPADRRRRIIAIAPAYATPISDWLSGSAVAWERVMRDLRPAERATVITALRAYEAALDLVSQDLRDPR